MLFRSKKPLTIPASLPQSPPQPPVVPISLPELAKAETPQPTPTTPVNTAVYASNQPLANALPSDTAPDLIANQEVSKSPPVAANAALGDIWASRVAQLIASDAVKSIARELALQSELVAIDGAVWTLRVESPSINGAATIE